MQASQDYDFVKSLSSCLRKLGQYPKTITAATLYTLLTQANALQCNNPLSFPYQLVGGPDHAGNCIPLDLAASVPNTTIPVLLALHERFGNLTDRILEIPGVTFSNLTDCCIIQQFTKLASLCSNSVTVWGLELLTDQNITADQQQLTQVEQKIDCPADSHLVRNLLITFIAFASFCALMLALFKCINRAQPTVAQEVDESAPINPKL